MGRRIAHAWGRRRLAGLWYSAIAVAALVVIVPLATCGGCVGSMSLGEVGFALGFVLTFGLLVCAVLAGIVAWGLLRGRSRAARLDALFAELGTISPSGGGLGSRAWEGRLPSGRPLYARLDRGPALVLRVGADVRTRAAFGADSALGRGAARALGRELAPVPGHDHLVGGGREPAFVQTLASAPGSGEALATLLTAPSPQLRSVTVAPGSVAADLRYLPLRSITIEDLTAWTQALAVLADHAESVPVADPLDG